MQIETSHSAFPLTLPRAAAEATIDLVAAESQGLALAVAAPDGALTYRELYEQASVIATQLLRLGVTDGDLVALCVPRSAGLIRAALGIREAGAAYVSLDPVHPDRRLREMLVDSGASAVVLGPGMAERLGLDDSDAIAVGELELVALAVHQPDRSHPGLAYVVYTSGSTGTPKGVLVSQAGLANLIAWHRSEFGLSPDDRCTQVAAPGFDAFAWEIWPCLTAGASLHIPPDSLRTDPVALRDWLVAEQITVSFLPTPLAEALLALEWPETASLRLLLTGGDRMHARPPAGLPFTVVNNYGVSEASVVSTSGVVAPGDGVPTIGRPINQVQIQIVDAGLRPVPDGEPGELLIGGVSLARGYLGRPELTSQRFVRSPYAVSADDRWYRTGDLVRRLASGELEFVGRSDSQVKVRGNRVEPGEVAAVVERHPAVARCVVTAMPDAAGDQSLVAFARAYGRTPPADDEVRGFAAQRLPTAMLPARFVWLEAFPITANGKIDVAALPALARAVSAQVSTSDEIELEIAKLVAEVLDVAEVSVSDNFIMLGGDSLLAARLMVRIADRFDVELPLRTVFEHPTIVELAHEVRQIRAQTTH